ncbi:MAG: HypC/HybG/HupF family hydrogenase formation chaperone [Pirellula sp.]
MCLGVPGRVIEWLDRDPLTGIANVDFGGVAKACHMACVPEAKIGEYVIVHAGVAISLVQESEANRIFEELQRLNLLDQDLDEPGQLDLGGTE